MREKLDVLKILAKSDSPIWLYGEAGTGKELAARFIHQNSKYGEGRGGAGQVAEGGAGKGRQKEGQFITINCAEKAIAVLQNNADPAPFNGVFAAWKEGCTLFVDEISLLPKDGQEELLSLIKVKEEHNFNFRLLTSTKRDVEALVRDGKFNAELYYKICVCTVLIPPLRDRREDIEPLARQFLTEAMLEVKNIFSGFSEAALEAMKDYYWPGNVRELKNTILAAAASPIASAGAGLAGTAAMPTPLIDKNFLFPHNDSIQLEGIAGGGGGEGNNRNLKAALNAFKSLLIKRVLKENDWNQTAAAASLGIQRTYLAKLIREMGLRKNRIGENYG